MIPRSTAFTLYTFFVRPFLEYVDVVFDNITNTLTQQIYNVQREALLVLMCAYKRTPTKLLYRETGLEHMSGRCKQHRLTILYTRAQWPNG